MKLPEQRIKIMGVVMARSGSKGVKSKNLLRIGEETNRTLGPYCQIRNG